MNRLKAEEQVTGIWLAILAYTFWGLFPLFFERFRGVSAVEVLCHRVIWSALFTFLIVLMIGKSKEVWKVLTHWRGLQPYLLSSLFLGINWALFIYGIELNDVLQLSLAYYINPLFNMLFGLFLFKERIGILGKIAIIFALLGLSYRLSDFEHFPWLAVTIALAFSIYGVLRKKTPVNSISALFIESVILVPFALLVFLWGIEAKTWQLVNQSWSWVFLFILTGPVTSIPLVFFSMAVKRIPYYLIGFIQYLSPTMIFVLAVGYFDQHWKLNDIITFASVWIGIVLVIIEQTRARQQRKLVVKAENNSKVA